MHLIIVADSARARFFTADEAIERVEETLDLLHPQAQLKAADVYTDNSGRRGTGSTAPHTSMKDAEAQSFARTVARAALERVDDHERFIIAAPPQFLGALRGAFDARVRSKVVASIDRDFTRVTIHELPRALRRHLSPTAGMA